METFLGKTIPPFFDGFFFQFKEFHISNVVFQIVCRISENELVDALDGRGITDPVISEKCGGFIQCLAFLMDSDIGKCVEAKDDGIIFLEKGGL